MRFQRLKSDDHSGDWHCKTFYNFFFIFCQSAFYNFHHLKSSAAKICIRPHIAFILNLAGTATQKAQSKF